MSSQFARGAPDGLFHNEFFAKGLVRRPHSLASAVPIIGMRGRPIAEPAGWKARPLGVGGRGTVHERTNLPE